MKTFLLGLACIAAAMASAARAADTNPPPRLTVELRDGSRVIGTSVEADYKFHSPLLGDLKMAVKDIRSVEFISTNAAKLTTANGDTLTVSFAEPEFSVKTSFGKVGLAVSSVRKLDVSASFAQYGDQCPDISGWWHCEGNLITTEFVQSGSRISSTFFSSPDHESSHIWKGEWVNNKFQIEVTRTVNGCTTVMHETYTVVSPIQMNSITSGTDGNCDLDVNFQEHLVWRKLEAAPTGLNP